VLHGFEGVNRVALDGKSIELKKEVNKFFAQLEKFDPIADPAPAPEEDVLVLSFPNSTDRIEIAW
jgi:hypothetical protein